MHTVLKRLAIAGALIAVCAVILALTRRYGVWVIIGIAVALFLLGLLRRDEGRGGGEGVPEGRDGGGGSGNREDR